MTTAQDELLETSFLDSSTEGDDGGLAEPSPSVSSCRRRRRHCVRQQIGADRRRCRSLSRDRERLGHNPSRTADDTDVIDGVQPLPDASLSENNARSSLSQSVDSVNTSASNKRKAVSTLPGNDEKSHRMSH